MKGDNFCTLWSRNFVHRSGPSGEHVLPSPSCYSWKLTLILYIPRALRINRVLCDHVTMMKLRDYLLDALKDFPGTRSFHIHALVSAPRKHQTLFTFALPRPKTYIQDILILLAEQSTPESPRIFVAAIEANLYHIPATSCAILYISKVDTTGQASSPSPTTHLVKAFLRFYVQPSTRPLSVDHIWIHLFARAQGQYLFPNSAEFPKKRPLADVKLCLWWKHVLTDVARQSVQSAPGSTLKLYYVLPGYSQTEAELSLKSTASSSCSPSWTYGHPYSQTDIPLPCPPDATNLGHFIPYFDDCPKSRFLDEIAYTAGSEGIKSPARKRPRLEVQASKNIVEEADEQQSSGTGERPLGELSKVTPDEFWERMSFRQECVAGAVTGFFILALSSTSVKDGATDTKPSPLAPEAGQVSPKLIKRILTTLMTGVEFSTLERAIKATETLENTIRGLCEGIPLSFSQPVKANPSGSPFSSDLPTTNRHTPERELASVISSATYLAPPRTPPRRGTSSVLDISPNPFPEPETSLQTYHSHIYASVSISNAPAATDKPSDTSSPTVTVLTVRKKKKN